MAKEELRKRLNEVLSSAGLSYMAGTVEDVENPFDYIPLIEKILNMSVFRCDDITEFAPHMVALIESITPGVSEMQSTAHNEAADFCQLVEEFLATKVKVRELVDTESSLVLRKNSLQDRVICLNEYEGWLRDYERTNATLSSIRDELSDVLSKLATIEEELSSFPFPFKLRIGNTVIWKENGNICVE